MEFDINNFLATSDNCDLSSKEIEAVNAKIRAAVEANPPPAVEGGDYFKLAAYEDWLSNFAETAVVDGDSGFAPQESDCHCIIHHPQTEEGRKRVQENLEYSRRVGDQLGILLALAQLQGCPK